MPIYEFGYRHWDGKTRGPLARWWTISETGIALAFRSRLLRRVLTFVWVPILAGGGLFFVIGQFTDPNSELGKQSFFDFLAGFFPNEIVAGLRDDPRSYRPAIWSMVFYFYFTYLISFQIILVTAIVGPSLVSPDLRSKAFLLYFSKPITRMEYCIGKGVILLAYLFCVSLVPALVLYFLSIVFSPSVETFLDTASTLPNLIIVSLVVTVPITLIVLYFSSLAADERFALFGWILVWLLGEVAFIFLSNTRGAADSDWICLVSIRQTTVAVNQAIFDVTEKIQALGDSRELKDLAAALYRQYPAPMAIGWLAALSVGCLVGLLRRISSPMKI